ncbi:MAG TPA: tRNA pseudouridine(38-40) synthase TruA [Desulfuromonadales bacterium]|nr:tRNA pseudouridine(38-40) synthase TruA [Desulfuromonadales bacterium]
MRKILLIVEYCGTGYVGWQIQPNGPSVQAVIEKALADLIGADVRIHSSGRTDAGVHARGMLAHFETASRLPVRVFREGLNARLPTDIAVREAREMPTGFHARYDARGKWYRYTLYRGRARSPLQAGTSWHLHGPLDLAAMRQAAELLTGRHDFGSFRSANCAAKTTERELYRVELVAEGDLLHLDFYGAGFLKNMVRMLVGTLVQIGRGKRPLSDIPKLLQRDPGQRCGPTAPPQGLCLMEVWLDRIDSP